MIDLTPFQLSTTAINSGSGMPVTIIRFAQTPYADALQAMQEFSNQRGADEQDQVWLIEHPPTYTQGTACQQQTLMPSDIAVVKTDRGGQITYHGPGQIVLYPLLNLRRFNLGVKALVSALEQSVINLLHDFDVRGERREDAPGVYVNEAKIAALGLRIRRGNSYHGLSFNLNMDLAPFRNIDPCGYQGLQVTQLSDLLERDACDVPPQSEIGEQLVERFLALI